MKKINGLIALALLLLFAACSEENSTENILSDGEDPEKFTVSGKVLDQDGEGVAGAEVYVEDNSSIGVAPAATATTGSDGSYSFELDGGVSYTINVNYSNSPIPDDSETILSLSSNQVINFQITVAKDRTVSGTVTDVDGNPVEGLTVRLSLSITGSLEDVEKTSTTNSSGYYEILNDVKDYTSWSLGVESSEYSFTSASSTSGFTMESDLTINFTQREDYLGNWLTDASGIPDSAMTGTSRSVITISSSTLHWFLYDTNDDLVYSTGNANYTVSKSGTGDIHEIRIPVVDSNGDLVNDFEGIFRVEKTQPKWTLTIELVDVLAEGNTAPTVAAGFGSANGGANGDAYVWTFQK